MEILESIVSTNTCTKRNGTVDLFRVLCAILVIIIHTKPFLDTNEEMAFLWIDVLPRIAVPFFFCIAGYYFIFDTAKDKRKTIRYLKKQFLLYFQWSILYFLIGMISALQQGKSILYYTVDSVIGFVLYGTRYHLWFYPVLLTVAFLFYVGTKNYTASCCCFLQE